MVQCPACGTKIDADFGMTSCPQCAAVFMVEMDGSIQDVPPEEGEFGEGEISAPTFEENPPLETEEAEAAFYEENPEAQASESNDMIIAADDAALEDVPLDETPVEEALLEEAEPSEEAPTEYSESFMDNMDTPEPSAEKSERNANDPLGVTAFDQSDASLLSEGLYYYDLKVSGLDSAQLRQEVIDALSDPRFDWLPDDLKKNISSGELILNNLNPIKTVLAVIKLQSLDVEVEWTQKLYTDDTVNKNQEAES